MKKLLLKIAVAIVFIYGFLGFLILPYYLQFSLSKIIEKNFAIQTYVDRIDFNPFTFEVRVDGFRLEDTKRKDILYLETFYVNLEPFSLLQNKIHLQHIKIDNFKADIDLDKNKTPNFQFLFALANAKEDRKEEGSKEVSTPPSLQIDKLDLTYLNILFTDNSKKEPYTLVTTPFDINLENISIDPNHTNNIRFKIDTKESGEIEIDSKLVATPFKAEGKIVLSNININKKFDYLKTDDIKFDLNSKRLNLDFEYKFGIAKEDMLLDISNIKLDVASINLLQDVYGVELNEFKTNVKQVKVTIAKELSYKVEELAVDLKSINFNDKNIDHSLTVQNLDLDVKTISSKKDEEIEFISSIKMPSKGSLKLQGKAVQEPLNVAVDIKLQNTTLKPYEKYVQEFVNLGIDSFFINLDSNLKYSLQDKKSDLKFSGDVKLEKIALSNTKQKQKVIDIKKIDINKLVYNNDFLDIKNVTINKPFIYASFNKDKTTNFSNLVKNIEEKEQKKATKETQQQKATSFGFVVKKLTLKDGNANIVDKTINPQFHTKEEKINIVVDNLTMNPKEKTDITHTSIMDKYAPVNAKGKLKLQDPLDDLVVSLELKNIDLPSLSMYSGKFIGNKIANGKLSLKLNHTIKDGQLDSTNNIKIKDIELGEKVESKDAINAPIGLAIALLEDSSGMIDLDIPMSGDVKSPKFDISDAISDVIVNTIVGIVTAPFKFLAILTGLSGDDDISNAGFIYGTSEIDPTQKEKLDTISKALVERPQLQIRIKPAYSLENDKKVLHEQKFQEAYPILSDTSKKFQELYKVIKEQFVKLYTDKEYKKLKGKEDEKYPYMIEKLKQTITVELFELETLAKNRAVSIEKYLITHGVNKQRIKIEEGYVTDKVDKKLNQVIVLFELDAK